LPELYGGSDVLAAAKRRLPKDSAITKALSDLKALSDALRDVARIRCFDLAELRGYHYHSGVVFAAYTEDQPYALALGGRYDEVGAAFVRARPATGFSMDLREVAAAGGNHDRRSGVLARDVYGTDQRLRSPATTLIVIAITAIPRTYDTSAWRSAVDRIRLDVRSESET